MDNIEPDDLKKHLVYHGMFAPSPKHSERYRYLKTTLIHWCMNAPRSQSQVGTGNFTTVRAAKFISSAESQRLKSQLHISFQFRLQSSRTYIHSLRPY